MVPASVVKVCVMVPTEASKMPGALVADPGVVLETGKNARKLLPDTLIVRTVNVICSFASKSYSVGLKPA